MKRPGFLATLVLCACGGGDGGNPETVLSSVESAGFSFAIITDIHIGEGYDSYGGQEDAITARARKAVARVNAENVAFVFILGDLTDSAEPAEFAKARAIFDGFSVPWYPIIGNHDMWTYTSSAEADAPVGDALFAQTFAGRFEGLVHNVETVWNPEKQCWSTFRNFEVRHGGYVFLGLDWNTRSHATVGKGANPGGDLHDFAGGTFPWLQSRLAALPADAKRVFLLQHQPFRTPAPVPDWIYAFSGAEKDKLRAALLAAAPAALYWGHFAGHLHREASLDAFDEWPGFAQVETDACKETAAVTLVRVKPDGTIEVLRLPPQ
ncbi:MAG: metallophosphoesterase [Planctomycetes bacterium]|nr:metallophosphoesterase [Planctomycetota bacterium]